MGTDDNATTNNGNHSDNGTHSENGNSPENGNTFENRSSCQNMANLCIGINAGDGKNMNNGTDFDTNNYSKNGNDFDNITDPSMNGNNSETAISFCNGKENQNVSGNCRSPSISVHIAAELVDNCFNESKSERDTVRNSTHAEATGTITNLTDDLMTVKISPVRSNNMNQEASYKLKSPTLSFSSFKSSGAAELSPEHGPQYKCGAVS